MERCEVKSIYCDGCGMFGDGARVGDLFVAHPRTILAKRGWKTVNENGLIKDYCYECSKSRGLLKPSEYFWWEKKTV